MCLPFLNTYKTFKNKDNKKLLIYNKMFLTIPPQHALTLLL